MVESPGPYAEEQLGLLLYNGGTVCSDGFTVIAADAICREMNFKRAILWDSHPGYSMERSQYQIKLDNVNCEIPIWKNCSFNARHHNCHHKDDVFLSCLLRGSVDTVTTFFLVVYSEVVSTQ